MLLLLLNDRLNETDVEIGLKDTFSELTQRKNTEVLVLSFTIFFEIYSAKLDLSFSK